VIIDLRKICFSLTATVVSAGLLGITAGCQSTKPAAAAPAAAAAVPLQPYTASDQSASAGVPADWKVTLGSNTVIQMTGSKGEVVYLGLTSIARNGAFQVGQKPGNGIDMSMPYAAPLGQKLTMILQHSQAMLGQPVSQFTIDSSTPMQVPPVVGQCGRFVADFTGQKGPMKLMAVLCSLPADANGNYKNVLLMGQAPTAVATDAAPAVHAIFGSYRIPPAWLQKKLAPFSLAPPPVSVNPGYGAGAINSSTILGEAGADNSAKCFDLTVLRETPQYQLPRSCGGPRPD
jgi:hypothetical protein